MTEPPAGNPSETPILAPPQSLAAVVAGGGRRAESLRAIEREAPPRVDAPPIVTDAPSDVPPRAWFRRRPPRGLTSCFASTLFHAGLLVALAMIATAGGGGSGAIRLIVTSADDGPLPFDAPLVRTSPSTEAERRQSDQALAVEHSFDVPAIAAPGEPSAAVRRPLVDHASRPGQHTDLLMPTDADVTGLLAGRSPDARARLVAGGGGTPESESAMERGLRWIMAQQRDDGSFSFAHLQPGNRNPGTETSTTAATGMALLPFLGAGQTHEDGIYNDTVRRALYYLISRARKTDRGADLQEGTMYAQGIATIALCEAYALTGDETMRPMARDAVEFILHAQNQRGGGWRYTPGEPGDTTVTGWQLMALKSAQMAGLEVPSIDIMLVDRFLDSVQSEYGARYGYMDPRPRDTCTAIGLLCRMYLGWRHENAALARGVSILDQLGPADDNMYLNYYATQVMHHYGGDPWRRWNPAMRDYLIDTQATAGQESGSWHFSGGRGDVGGRLYNTAMAVMVLQVYYRHLPLYRHRAIDEAF